MHKYMENFHDATAPAFLSFYAKKNSFFDTEIVSTVSNHEYRVNYSGVINKYYFENARLSLIEINILKDFFVARRGMMSSFWFFDDKGIVKKARFNNNFIEYTTNCDGSFTIKNLEIVEIGDE